jgi:hypothetical protein
MHVGWGNNGSQQNPRCPSHEMKLFTEAKIVIQNEENIKKKHCEKVWKWDSWSSEIQIQQINLFSWLIKYNDKCMILAHRNFVFKKFEQRIILRENIRESISVLTRVSNVKIHKIPILMHQMRISTNYVSSVMLRPKNLEIRNVMTEKT